jgi:hypothetical protein
VSPGPAMAIVAGAVFAAAAAATHRLAAQPQGRA